MKSTKYKIIMYILRIIIVVTSILVFKVNMNHGEILSDCQVGSSIYKNCDFISSENGSTTEKEISLNDSSYGWFDQLNSSNLKHSMIYTVIMTVVYLIVFFVGIVGNSVVILVIGLKPHIRTVTNLFILNLAVADMFVLLFCLPATLIASLFKPWVLGYTMCWGVAYVQGASVVASAYSLAAISVDRYKLICHRTMSTHGFSKRQTMVVLFAIWSLAVLIPLPWVFVFELQVSEAEGYTICSENWNGELLDMFYYIFGNLFCCYILPFICILSANVKIWLKVSRHKTPRTNIESLSPSEESSHNKSRRSRTRRGVGKMLTIVTFAFLICWLPLYILATRVKVTAVAGEIGESILWAFLPLAQWLAYANSCVNPLFYAFFNSNIRKKRKCSCPSFFRSKCCLVSETVSVRETPNRVRIVDGPSIIGDKTVKHVSQNEILNSALNKDLQETLHDSINDTECTSHRTNANDESKDKVNNFPSSSSKITDV